VYFTQAASAGPGHAMTMTVSVSVAVVAAIAALGLGPVLLLPRDALTGDALARRSDQRLFP